MDNNVKNAIIIEASSGIGAALAQTLAAKGYSLGLAARRMDLLGELSNTLPTPSFVRKIDISETNDAMNQFRAIASELDDIDLVIISSGIGHKNQELNWALEEETIATNVLGFAAIANEATGLFVRQGHGTLVGISSIAAIRGNGGAPAYGASKAFVSNYLASLRHKFAKLQSRVVVLEVQPGFVDTAMAKGEGLFWVASPEKAAQQIVSAIENRKTHVYITRRWQTIAWILRLIPNWIYNRI